jgi:hypothetical protein
MTEDDDGFLVDSDGEEVWCSSFACDARAVEEVAVSVNEPHDETRCYCEACLDVYYVGVQHGRYHEAALHGSSPGRDSSQELPRWR